jgi:hypothetical protein
MNGEKSGCGEQSFFFVTGIDLGEKWLYVSVCVEFG